jgi:hypothetical protein
VVITSPANNAQVVDIVNVTADASDNVGVTGVQFLVDGVNSGVEDTTAPYVLSWDSRGVSNGAHAVTARARDAAGNSALAAGRSMSPTPTNSRTKCWQPDLIFRQASFCLTVACWSSN